MVAAKNQKPNKRRKTLKSTTLSDKQEEMVRKVIKAASSALTLFAEDMKNQNIPFRPAIELLIFYIKDTANEVIGKNKGPPIE